MQRVLDEWEEHVAFTVLLCTGAFPDLRPSGLVIRAQAVVDHLAAALAAGAERVGILVPLEEQTRWAGDHMTGTPVTVSHASPYRPDRLETAAHELAGADLIVMHCMGYTEAMRATVAAVTGRPVLLARRAVAAAIAQLL